MRKVFNYIPIFLIAWLPLDAMAMVLLKQVQVSSGAQIDLLFDGKVNKSQVQTEFFNDIIQLSMVDVTVYPAKISSVNGSILTKIFAYQYAPRLVRCRLTVNGNAEDYKDRLVIQSNGKILTVKISEPQEQPSEKSDKINLPAAAPIREASAHPAVGSEAPQKADELDVEEKKLLTKVLNSPVQALNARAPKPVQQKLGGGIKPLPSLGNVLMKLGVVMGIFGIFVILLKKVMTGKSKRPGEVRLLGVSNPEIASVLGEGRIQNLQGTGGSRGVFGFLGQLAQSGLGKLGQKEKMIEVLSTHHLGPKQSIAVVRVCGKQMVLGIANESISLISQLTGSQDKEIEESELDAAGTATFSELLKSEKSKPAFPNGVRSRIRSRLEGLKPL